MSDTLVNLLGADRLPWHLRDLRVVDAMNLQGRVAAVTGGGGISLGQAIVHRLAGLGATVAVVDRDISGAKRVAAEAAAKWGASTEAFEADVSDSRSVSSLMSNITERFGTIDIWVNNVGLATLPGQPAMSFMELTPEDIDWFLGVDLKGTLYCTRAVLDVMVPRGRGRIINIASESGKSWAVKRPVYSTSKAGIIGFTRSLAHELSGTGVSVVTVCPGIMLTPEGVARLRALPEDDEGESGLVLRDSFSRVAAGRCSIPEEVANLVAFLATDAGSYIQGTSLSAGGGMAD